MVVDTQTNTLTENNKKHFHEKDDEVSSFLTNCSSSKNSGSERVVNVILLLCLGNCPLWRTKSIFGRGKFNKRGVVVFERRRH